MVQQVLNNGRLDRVAIALSALCLVHCVASALALAMLATAAGALFDPLIHEIGLALAIVIGIAALGWGYRAHGKARPALIGGTGISLMSLALLAGHGALEVPLTMAGVTLLAYAHLLNRRAVR